MSEPTFGISITRIDNEARPAVWSDMAVVGIVGTAPAANATIFPLNTPVFMYSDDPVKLAALGVTGTLLDAVTGVNDQLGEFQVSARVVIVRVEQGVDEDETQENVVGTVAAKSGINAFLQAGPLLGLIPRIIIAPGFTYQQFSGLETLTLTTQGSLMTEPPVVTFAGGGAAPGKVLPTATAVMGTGADADKVVELLIVTRGVELDNTVTVGFTGGGVAVGKVLPTALATVVVNGNVVAVSLPAVLNKLLAHAIIDGPATTQQDYIDWRETISNFRLIPLETAVKVGVAGTVKPGSPRIAGLAVRRDHEFQGRPFHSWANQPIAGIVGPSRAINFSLTDGATEGQAILAANGGIIVRGEMGVESAIASGGFVYIGTDNASEDILWQFYNITRGRDYIHLMFLRTLRFYLGRFNITAQTIEAIRNTISFNLRDLRADGDILGYSVSFTRDQNSPEQLRLGRFTINFAAEEAPVLRYLGIQSARYRPALDALLDDLLSQLDAVTG